MAKSWRIIRVPADLATRLDRLAEHFEAMHTSGKQPLPEDVADRVPLHFVIRRGLDSLEGHRLRARQSRRKPRTADPSA